LQPAARILARATLRSWLAASACLQASLSLAAAPQGEAPGPLLLLGERAELEGPLAAPAAGQASVLLVAAAALSPTPIDARDWGGDETTWVVSLAPEGTRAAETETLARLRAAHRIALGPGTTREWSAALGLEQRSSALAIALREAWRSGATLIGRGESASILTAGFPVSDLQEGSRIERNPRKAGRTQVAPGLAFLPWAALETEERARGRLEGLVDVVALRGVDVALYLPVEGALRVDVRAGKVHGLGRGGALLLDGRRARRNVRSFDGAELSLLGAGMVWSEREGLRDRALPSAGGNSGLREVEDPWLASHWFDGLAEPRASWTLRGADATLSFEGLAAPAQSDPPMFQPAPRARLALERP
jgi:hypothetical protein